MEKEREFRRVSLLVVAMALLGSSLSAGAKPVEAEKELAELQRPISFALHVKAEEGAFNISDWMSDNGSGGFPVNYFDEKPKQDPFEVRPAD
jgi:hypothetical protein